MSIRAAAVLGLLLSNVVFSQVETYECDLLPEDDGWVLEQTWCGPEQWVENGKLFQHVELCPGWENGEFITHERFIPGFEGTDQLFAEWVVLTDGIPEEIGDVAPASLVLWDGNALIYHFTIADERVRFLRQFKNPVLFFDIEAGVPHTYRLEFFGEGLETLYILYIDGEVVDEGVPEGPLFNHPHDPGFQFRAKAQFVDSTTIWSYIRWGRIADDASGDFDSDGVVGPLDFP